MAVATFTPPSNENLGGFRQSDGDGNVEDGPAKDRVVQATEAVLHHALCLEDRKCRHRVHVADDASKVRQSAKDGARNPVLSPVKGDRW